MRRLGDWRIWYGFCLLLTIAVLALCIGLGKVEQETSYGLEIVLGCLSTLVGGFAQWAFSRPQEPPKP